MVDLEGKKAEGMQCFSSHFLVTLNNYFSVTVTKLAIGGHSIVQTGL